MNSPSSSPTRATRSFTPRGTTNGTAWLFVKMATCSSATQPSTPAPLTRRRQSAKQRRLEQPLVLIQSQYTDTVTGTTSRRRSRTHPKRSPPINSGSVYGSEGLRWLLRNLSDDRPWRVSASHQLPYSVDRYDYAATFWAKSKLLPLGVHVNDLTDDLRKQLGSNRGVVVNVVVKGSPASLTPISCAATLSPRSTRRSSLMSSRFRIDRLGAMPVSKSFFRHIATAEEREVPVRLDPSSY